MMKIAVLSDTHGLLRPEVIKVIGECDAVLHAGDINSQKIVDQMKEAAGKHAPVGGVSAASSGVYAGRCELLYGSQ